MLAAAFLVSDAVLHRHVHRRPFVSQKGPWRAWLPQGSLRVRIHKLPAILINLNQQPGST
jgi:hypothetical protein